MFKNLCLLLLTTFFICKATDVVSLLLAKEKITIVCNSDDCENEKSEVEKITDDPQLVPFSESLHHFAATSLLKVTFTYAVKNENEIFKNLFSPPPELI